MVGYKATEASLSCLRHLQRTESEYISRRKMRVELPGRKLKIGTKKLIDKRDHEVLFWKRRGCRGKVTRRKMIHCGDL